MVKEIEGHQKMWRLKVKRRIGGTFIKNKFKSSAILKSEIDSTANVGRSKQSNYIY
jgi:hypothetical protein